MGKSGGAGGMGGGEKGSVKPLGYVNFTKFILRPIKCFTLHVITGSFQEKSANLFSVIRENSTVANILHSNIRDESSVVDELSV